MLLLAHLIVLLATVPVVQGRSESKSPDVYIMATMYTDGRALSRLSGPIGFLYTVMSHLSHKLEKTCL